MVTPEPLEIDFSPLYAARRKVADALLRYPGHGVLRVALQRGPGSVSRHEIGVLPEYDPDAGDSMRIAERWLKFLVWSRGVSRLYLVPQGPVATRVARAAVDAYAPGGPRHFDCRLMSSVYGHDLEVRIVAADDLPAPCEDSTTIGGHLDGCRIGFDLGASDLKVAAVIDGVPVFSEETPWRPSVEPDPEYHLRHVQGALERAAAQLPRVDAIGGSAAGIYVDGRVKVASIFRAVPAPVFADRVEDMFVELGARWGVPIATINDGDVAALAGAMAAGTGGVMGIAMGSSQAAGYVDRHGRITGWLNELAFAPVDLSSVAPLETWSGDCGVGASYFSQQAVDRLATVVGIDFDRRLGLPERLIQIQDLAAADDQNARRVFEAIGVYLAHTIPWYHEFYDFDIAWLLGRVSSGVAGELLLQRADAVLRGAYPGLAEQVKLRLPSDEMRRVGQAVAAASLPALR